MRQLLLFIIIFSGTLFPQLKELEVKPTTQRGAIPVNRDNPDKAAIFFYTQFDNLQFWSNYGIIEIKGDPAGGKYIVIIEPVRQTIEVRAPGYKTEMIRLNDLQPRDVLYYEVSPKKDAGFSGVSEVGITFQVSPSDAAILLDGKTFPNNQTMKVSLGNHSVRIDNPGYSSYEKEINVTPDQTFFKIDLQKVQLSAVTIRSNPPNATVYINNENKGTTEVGFFLYSGVYDLRLELPDHIEVNEKLTVVPSTDKTKNVFVYNLVKDKGYLKISVNPADAKITLNKNPISAGTLELNPGKYSIAVIADKYESYLEEVEIIRGQTLTRSINLEKNTGMLVLDVKPLDATISINKEVKTGSSFEMAPGMYELEVSAPTYYPQSESFQLEKGKTLIKKVTLKQKTGSLQFTIKPLDAAVTLSQSGIKKYEWEGINLLSEVPEGTYDLTAKSQGYKSYSGKITIRENQTTIEDIQMTPGSDTPEGMVLVEGGTFTMGSNYGDSDEKPTHKVTVSNFLIGKCEVTQALWNSVMGSNPSYLKGSDRPVEQVSWYDAVEFCNKLSEKEGLQKAYSGSVSSIRCDFTANGYRLPTEAEWEYAARGGKNGRGYEYSGSNDLDDVAWYSGNSESKTKEVGKKQTNELGIYDMSGNVWEWCWDWYSGNYYSTSPLSNPKGPDSGSYRVLRGGSWNDIAERCRVAYRGGSVPVSRYSGYGLRLARTR